MPFSVQSLASATILRSPRRNEQSDCLSSLFLTVFAFLLYSIASHCIANSGVTRSFALSYLIAGTVNNPYDVKSITDTAAAGHPWATQSRAYGYDKVDRLLSATSTTPGNDAYGYDGLDNATTYTLPAGSVSPTYNALNQVSTWGTKTYAYDLDGNLLSGDGARTYKWDAENRLIEIDYVGSTSKNQFSYDGMGHRMVDVHTPSSGSPTTTRYMWCGSSICQDRDGSDNVLRRDLDEGEYNATTSQKLIYMPDQLGSVRDVIDATTGSLVQSYDYTPYGATARTSGTTPTDYQYAGLFRHSPSNLNLSATRPQDGGTGRWLGRDLIREAGGINLYDYTQASPVNGIDPEGLLKVYIWNSGPFYSPSGHASIKLNNGTYISFGPDCQCNKNTVKAGQFSYPGGYGESFVTEARNNGFPNTTISIEGLDEAAIDAWWRQFQAEGKQYNPVSPNCSTVAADALAAGGGTPYALLGGGFPFHLFWDPNDVKNYSNAINTGMGRLGLW